MKSAEEVVGMEVAEEAAEREEEVGVARAGESAREAVAAAIPPRTALAMPRRRSRFVLPDR
ncbi:hypothetical protein ACIU1J_25995 [Azospirillum doebereinerae]|uniref:hypothetical protein n=1 Tax=Azospirillum doebereinerae TaxID=92933 RepID=UPI00384FE5E3